MLRNKSPLFRNVRFSFVGYVLIGPPSYVRRAFRTPPGARRNLYGISSSPPSYLLYNIASGIRSRLHHAYARNFRLAKRNFNRFFSPGQLRTRPYDLTNFPTIKSPVSDYWPSLIDFVGRNILRKRLGRTVKPFCRTV